MRTLHQLACDVFEEMGREELERFASITVLMLNATLENCMVRLMAEADLIATVADLEERGLAGEELELASDLAEKFKSRIHQMQLEEN